MTPETLPFQFSRKKKECSERIKNRSIRKGEQAKEAAKEKLNIAEYFMLSVLQI
jgi:hypothetical protein